MNNIILQQFHFVLCNKSVYHHVYEVARNRRENEYRLQPAKKQNTKTAICQTNSRLLVTDRRWRVCVAVECAACWDGCEE